MTSENVPEKKTSNDLLLALLNPTIQRAVDKYYGGISRQYGLYDAKLVDIVTASPGQFHFLVTVQVTTFTGAHNPPYGIETIIIEVDPDSVKVIDYRHEEEQIQ